ncbi:radical SAM protein [Actinospica sp. MGRD01-02]|uniref:Radical SAM protein n=1 Tax=Actinospica acidithermotolerans TaxID=2828514 RepID=A0A941E8Z6_9ACTN|nr:radical SAM protein [Actinospica acidithermotolerans]MBR7826012.1 radical SAM protein [Actinospica acidithermotolerans]
MSVIPITPASAGPPASQASAADTLDLAGKIYQESVLPHVLTVADGGRLPAPLVIDLDPTTVCDLACPECISSNVLHHGQIARDRIVELAEELAASQVQAVILIGGGEPLLHRSIDTVIDTLHAGGIRLGLVTNGTTIDRHLDRLAEKLSWVRVSVDAATEPVYDAFRPSRGKDSAFPGVMENMQTLARRKRGRLGYSFLLMQRFGADGTLTDSNYHEVYAAGLRAKEMGCDYFELKAMLDMDHFTVNQQQSHIDQVLEQWGRLEELQDESFHLLRSSNWEAVRQGSDPHQPKDYSACAVAGLRTTITPTGVYVCPYHRGNPHGLLGDIRDTSFAELWKNADTARIDPRRDCRFHCARHPTNVEIGALAKRSEPVTAVPDYDPFI